MEQLECVMERDGRFPTLQRSRLLRNTYDWQHNRVINWIFKVKNVRACEQCVTYDKDRWVKVWACRTEPCTWPHATLIASCVYLMSSRTSCCLLLPQLFGLLAR